MREKKYELTDEVKSFGNITLYRIRALRDFMNIKKGEVGGFIEKESNLSHSGDAWVYGDAKVYWNAKVYWDAEVYWNAKVSGNAKVYGDAWVYGDAEVSGNAKVYGDAKVSGDAEVSGNAKVSGNAEVSGNAKVYGNAINIIGYEYHITLTDNHMAIGCEMHTFTEWRKSYKAICRKHNKKEWESRILAILDMAGK